MMLTKLKEELRKALYKSPTLLQLLKGSVMFEQYINDITNEIVEHFSNIGGKDETTNKRDLSKHTG